jgi:hypothetical protein
MDYTPIFAALGVLAAGLPAMWKAWNVSKLMFGKKDEPDVREMLKAIDAKQDRLLIGHDEHGKILERHSQELVTVKKQMVSVVLKRMEEERKVGNHNGQA